MCPVAMMDLPHPIFPVLNEQFSVLSQAERGVLLNLIYMRRRLLIDAAGEEASVDC